MMHDTQRTATALLGELRDTRHVPGWFATNPERLLSLVRAEVANNRAERATELLVEFWQLVADDADERALCRLHECGILLSSALPTSLLVARGFRLGASVLRRRGLLRLAAAQGMFELAVHRRRDDDPDAIASALFDLAATYREQGRRHKEVGCLDEALEIYGLNGDTAGFARVLMYLGGLMVEVGRCDSAVKYLSRAAKVNEQLGQTVALSQSRALLSRTYRLLGDHHAADRHLNRALAPFVGVDEVTAEWIRDLGSGVRQFEPDVP